ncbi:MAG: shikimate dehydrogenase [Pseudomonadota bacterium]
MTTRVGVVGWPVEHSRSPMMFAHWFDATGVHGVYERIPVPPEEGAAFFRNFPADLHGVSVTMPHKGVAAASTQAEPVASRLGSVNTVWRDGETVRGTSTDGAGFVASLDAAQPGWRESKGSALVLGAGGAAAAVADALTDAGKTVVIANRTFEKADTLAKTVGGRAVEWGALHGAMDGTALLVNTTSLGMKGTPQLELDLSGLPDTAIVADIVYVPLVTPLLMAAEARGLAAVDGLGMLLHQGALQFERWFGLRPAVDDALRAKVVASL